MRYYIKAEFKRSIFSINTVIAFFLCFICIFIAGSDQSMDFYMTNKNAVTFFLLQVDGSRNILILFTPLIVAIPYSSSYALDKKNNFLSNIYIRMDRRKFLFIRAFVNAIVGSSIVAFSLMITLLTSFVVFFKYSINLPSGYNIRKSRIFSNVYNFHPIEYALLVIFLFFIAGLIFSTIGLAISSFIVNEYLAIIFPFIFSIVEAIIAAAVGIEHVFSFLYIINPSFYMHSTIQELILQQLEFGILSIVIFYIGVIRKRDKYE